MARLLGIFTLALFVPAALLAADPKDDKATSDAKTRRPPLVGEYRITSGEKNGEAIPEERLKDTVVAITEDTFAVVDREKKELYSAKYTLKKQPGEKGVWQIDLESKAPREGDKAIGLIKREGKEVWLIYALGETRPDGFEKTTEGQHLFKLTRTGKGADQKPPDE